MARVVRCWLFALAWLAPALAAAEPELSPAALWHERIAFRDLLRTDQVLAEEYGTLKRDLARRFEFDREGYTDAKYPFIARVLGLPK